ncbi:hypothetical protein CSC62_06655 [Pseudoxanthomonas jiangsuensis]|uniref:hypothetical protein n=1 Tax=Pseudoxanthomonas jiangsuensis TaxID=619688 RepID=UPI001391BEF6|nr:hypothetical protein [Pseudoxanthomonas jiangsuensis]KAF1698054.1 hypothetical protein CSC62_06655 [Pseudoxanthomonas jiangsuensis]
MNKFKKFPDFITLDDDSEFILSIVQAFHFSFPADLRQYARLDTSELDTSFLTEPLSIRNLLNAAYAGAAPLPVSRRRFFKKADWINRRTPENPPKFRTDSEARENSAASEWGMSFGELKRLYKHLDTLAKDLTGLDSFEDVFKCDDYILDDRSASAPENREVYVRGPLYLWDFAKAVKEHGLDNMCFGTYLDWVLFTHLDNGIVSGLALQPAALRFGNFDDNPVFDIDRRHLIPKPFPIMEVPEDVRAACMELANRKFPDHPFDFMPPPQVELGVEYGSNSVTYGFVCTRAEA